MQDFLEQIRTHFNVIQTEDHLSLTLINPNLSLQIIGEIKDRFRLMHRLRSMEVVIIESVNFDDELLTLLAHALPESLTSVTFDFTGCVSLRGSGFLELFERLSNMELTKLKLDCSQVVDINDIVMEGLTMLLDSLDSLEELYLDFYEVSHVTDYGYLLFASTIDQKPLLKHIHLDLSANPNLTEDSLDLFFSNLPNHLLTFGFRILDIQHIGGGSFFKLGEKLAQMHELTALNLTISSFSDLNFQGVEAIFKGISSVKTLTFLELNVSNINLPEKILSSLKLPPFLKKISLDISCNKELTDRDVINLAIGQAEKVSLNFDFDPNISEEAVELISEQILDGKCVSFTLADRSYSDHFLNGLVSKAQQCETLSQFSVLSLNPKLQSLLKFQQFLEVRRKEEINHAGNPDI